MKTTLEREVKLDVDTPFELPEFGGGKPLPSRVFTSTYHDTPARSLGRAGITLRRRVENGKSLWQLKLPRGGAARAELEEPGGPGMPPPELRRLLTAHLRHGAFEPVATLRTRRSGVLVPGVAEVTLDTVDVLDAGRSAGGFAEVEVELVGGSESDLRALAKTVRRAGARKSDGAPKLMRVLQLPRDRDPGENAPLLDHLRHLLQVQLRELEARDPGVRVGDDPEDLHRYRVATRRARSLVHATRPLLGDTLVHLGEELRWLAEPLSGVRDLDVLLDHLREEVATLDRDEDAGHDLLAGISREREQRREELLGALDSPRYLGLLDQFETVTAMLPAFDGDARRLAADEFRRLRRAAARLPSDPTDDELHALRMKGKRVRYAAELAALSGGTAAGASLTALKKVQDVIGEHQDAVVAEDWLRKLASATTAVAAGRLIERESARKGRMRAAYPKAVAAALESGRRDF